MKRSVKIAILDSGVKKEHIAFRDMEVCGFSLSVSDGEVIRGDDFGDSIGHGTGIYYLVKKGAPEADITNIKIFAAEGELTQKNFELILSYISENYSFDVINISMGFLRCGNTDALQRICDRLREKGSILVSAFDNNGAVSFPAALDGVIGVDGADDVAEGEFTYVKNGIINIIGKNANMRTAFINPDYIIVKGTSFLCARVSAAAANYIAEHDEFSLRGICSGEMDLGRTESNHLNFEIKRAAVFPFNKEIHALARYEDMLSFEVADYYAPRITGYVGKRISDILPGCESGRVIKNVSEICYSGVDTLIFGHIGELRPLIGQKLIDDVVRGAMDAGVNISFFENPAENVSTGILQEGRYFYPKYTEKNLNRRFGKMFRTDRPVLCVAGTNSKQGKFSLQLYIRKKMTEYGYTIGEIGTEPTAPLFGMDEVFPCGYNGQVELDSSQTVTAINGMIWDITKKNVDLILCGVQSGFIAYNDYNALMFPIEHQTVAAAMQPDATVLCINPFDDIGYIVRTIKAIEGLCGGRVIALVCFPMSVDENWKGAVGKKRRISAEEETMIKHSVSEAASLPVYILGSEAEMTALVDHCIKFFSGEN